MYNDTFDDIYNGIKKAVEVEKKRQYINVVGNKQHFPNLY